MKKWMKGILIGFCIVLILGKTALGAVFVIDKANLFPSDTSLQERTMQLSEQLNAQIVIVTLDSKKEGVSYDNIEVFGQSFYYENRFGAENGGSMLLIDVGQRMYTVFYEGGLLTEKANKKISEQLQEILEEDNYTEAAETYLDLIQKYVIDEEKVGVLKEDILIYLFIAVALSGIVVAILVFTRNHDTKPSGSVYMGNNGVEVLDRRDQFIHMTVTKHKIEKDSHSKDSGSAGGSF